MTSQEGPLCLLVCHGFAREFRAALAAEGLRDVAVAEFPTRCGRPPLDWDEIRRLLPDPCQQVFVLGRACLGGLAASPADFPPLRLLAHEQCFDLIASPARVRELLESGAYLMTSTWIGEWRRHLAELGFPVETTGADDAAGFFKDFARQLVLLDTGLDPDAPGHLDEMAAALGLPGKPIPVGLEQTRALLRNLTLEWRLEEERQRRHAEARNHARELAEHVTAMDLLARLARGHSEQDVTQGIEDLFRLLFAPGVWHLLPVENGKIRSTASVPDDLLALARGLEHDYAWTSSGSGFVMRIVHDAATLAIIVADGFAFPEHREHYLNMALGMSGVCALALENARTRQRLIEAEKMASLGVLVAGVAHEINTPVGIGLTAASTLSEQTQLLARQFAARRMTQSDLRTYLADADAEAKLIVRNLERIGKLIDRFRKVAVEKQEPGKRPVRFLGLIEEVVAGVEGGRLGDRVAVNIVCDADLEIETVASDWVSVLSNLLSNSLQHGFKGRERGAIDIVVTRTESTLTVDYSDDGVGLSREAKQRIFDPFFTTDHQHGIGLGMHLVYNLVTQRFGGRIVCDTAADAGSHFRIEVPC